jgi:predicted metal-binding protein
MTDTREELEALLRKHGYTDYKWIEPRDIVVAQWVRMKCMYGCGSYGRNASCPPNVPSVAECRAFLDNYDRGVIIHFQKAVEKPEERHAWSKGINKKLLELEREVFLAGHQKAFLLFMDSCHLCDQCPGDRTACNHPRSARPSPEGLGIDVFSTVRQAGYPIQVLTDYDQAMNRYAFLLIE